MIPAEVQEMFTTIFPLSSYLLPALYIGVLLLLIYFGAQWFMKGGFKRFMVAGPIALAVAFGVIGVGLNGAMEASASPENIIRGHIVSVAESGLVTVSDNSIDETHMVLLETSGDGLIGPLETTTSGVENAIGHEVVLSCDLDVAPAQEYIQCSVDQIIS